jgi:arylsulfatase A-like enzyme
MLVVAVDGLRASALGAYGNTSFATPALDRLAAESFLVDWCFAGSPELPLVYRSLWQSTHVLRLETAAESWPSLPRWFGDRGYATTLITDEPLLASLFGASEFDERVERPLWPVSRPSHEADRRSPDSFCGVGRPPHNRFGAASDRAEDIAQTALAQLLAAACECIAQPLAVAVDERDQPQLIWVHSRGMYGPWDAPLQLQESLLDEDDPAPYDIVEPPDVVIGRQDDPDAVFLYGCAYAAQVMVLDACINGLMAAADAAWPDGNWLLVLLGVRGFPLGEHGRVGGVDGRLFADQLHVPWLVRFPSGEGRLARTSGLASHFDLLPTLVDFITGEAPRDRVDGMSILPLARGRRPEWRDAVISAGPTGARSIRTPGWCLRYPPGYEQELSTEGRAEAELYVRPDDRWEANDVAKLCTDVVAGLIEAMSDASRQIQDGGPVPAEKLPDELRLPVE